MSLAAAESPTRSRIASRLGPRTKDARRPASCGRTTDVPLGEGLLAWRWDGAEGGCRPRSERRAGPSGGGSEDGRAGSDEMPSRPSPVAGEGDDAGNVSLIGSAKRHQSCKLQSGSRSRRTCRRYLGSDLLERWQPGEARQAGRGPSWRRGGGRRHGGDRTGLGRIEGTWLKQQGESCYC